MTKTSNYNLPQWEASDEIRREDFNDAMETIDTALEEHGTKLGAAWSDDNKPYVVGSVSVASGLAEGSVVATFDFEPKFAIISASSVGLIRQDGTARVCMNTTYIANSSYYLSFRLSGNQLTLYSRGTNANISTPLSYMAFR